MENNLTGICYQPIQLEQIISIIIIVFSSVVGIVLNMVLAIVIFSTTCHGSRSRQFQTLIILSISISDLAYLICAPVHDISVIFNHRIVGFTEMCRTFAFTLILTQGVSSLSLCLLSFDRYRAIIKPMQHRQWQKKWRYALATAFIWTVSILMTIPQLTISNHVSTECDSGPDMYWCDHVEFGTFPKVYYTILVLVFYLLPLFFMSVCYITIAYKLRQSPRFETNESQTKATRQRRKLSLSLIVISISFGICWFPMMFVKLCSQYINVFNSFDLEKWVIFVKACPIFVYFNCSLDPVIIFTLSRKYRTTLKKAFKNWKLLPKSLSFQRRSTCHTETSLLENAQLNHTLKTTGKRSFRMKVESPQ